MGQLVSLDHLLHNGLALTQALVIVVTLCISLVCLDNTAALLLIPCL